MKILGAVSELFAGMLVLVIVGFCFVVLSMSTLKKLDEKFFPPMSVVYAVYGETDCEKAVDPGTGRAISCAEAMKRRYEKVYIAPKSLRTAE